MELAGHVGIVTGAARGLGKAIATTLAERGMAVALIDVQDAQLQETAAELAAEGARILPIVADVTVPAQVEAMVAQVRAGLGPVDVLVNNAGTFSVIAPVWESDPELWFRDIKTNLYGSYLVSRAVVQQMVARGRGYVINIVSSGGVGDPHPYSTSYASSKAGLMRLTEGLAAEVAEHGIVVFALAPPAILTEMTRFILEDPGGRKWRPTFRRAFEEGRDHPPELVAHLVVELLSGKADQLTGRYILATADLDTLVSQADQIVEEDLWTLRIRKRGARGS
jgi:NAD(P)-dependent dehydrogenase (short-subunit alcohol dehydrogenase family)